MSTAATPLIESSVLFETRGRLGVITLNRPAAINALNHEMVAALQSTLGDWAVDDTVGAVLLVGSGERGLCAGGDIVAIYNDARDGGTASVDFWRDEYLLDATIARYPKPFIAIMDGIVLGGGIGLSAHASHRVVTQRSSIGLPETTIGFVPDVGGTWLLSRAAGELGTRLALTAGSMTGADAIAVGFADHFVRSQDLPALIVALETQEPDAALAAAAAEPEPSQLLADREWIDAAFAGNDVSGILSALAEIGTEAATTTAATIARKSPTALKITLASLRRARDLPNLEAVLRQEFRVSVRSLRNHDLAEGIRAQVIDKDRAPRWDPASLDEVSDAAVEAHFAPLPASVLELSV